ncbi:MAG: ABC transporter permease [Treponema sp.]|nr:ABC transporter permease [Treponema sp.]
MLEQIFGLPLISATVRASTPILFAAMSASITQQANITNIGTEGIMLMSAFVAVLVSFYSGSWMLAVLAAIVAGIIMAMIMAAAHLKYHAEITAIGIAINLFALASTRFMLREFLGATGSFISPNIVGIPRIALPFVTSGSAFDQVFNNWSIMEVLGIALVFALWFVFYRTVWGLRLRAVGRFYLAAETAGIRSMSMKYQAMLISGVLGGLAGAYLSLGFSRLFLENMANGRGFMGVAAMFFGGANPVFVWFSTLLFGFTQSLGARLQAVGLPSQFVLMLPYLITIVVLSVSLWRKSVRSSKLRSSLNVPAMTGKETTM